jgi:hypothetical protein
MRSKWITTAVVALCLVLFWASMATAQLLICLSEPSLKGEHNVAQCVKSGHKFVFINKNGIAEELSPDEMQLTLAFRPMIANLKAYGMEHAGQSAKIPALPRIGDQLQ